MDVIRSSILPRRTITIGVLCIWAKNRVFHKEVGMGDFLRLLVT